MSLTKIAASKRKRRFLDGGNADPEGTADAGRADGTAGVEGQGGFGGPSDFGSDAGHDAVFGTTGVTYSGVPAAGEFDLSQIPAAGLTDLQGQLGRQYADRIAGLGMFGKAAKALGLADKAGAFLAERAFSGQAGGTGQVTDAEDRRPPDRETDPMQSGIAQTTPGATAADTGPRKYIWDPMLRQYVLSSLGSGANPMGYAKGQVFQMAAGGMAPSGIAAGVPRFVQGGGTGLSDSVPVTMDDGGQGRLADGEFVIPADVVSGLGGGSSKAGADMLYQMMERIRQLAHGSKEQIRPVDPSQVMPA